MEFKHSESTIEYRYVIGNDEWEGYKKRSLKLVNENQIVEDIWHVNYYRKEIDENPIKAFIGEWEFKDDIFITNFSGNYNEIINPDRSFIVKELNTKNSILWVEDLGDLQANALWIYNFRTNKVEHLSNSSINSSASGSGKLKKTETLI